MRNPSGQPIAIVWHAFAKAVLACLHFSVETLSTFNDGEIVPATWYAKLAVDLQVLMGLGITVLTVGPSLLSPSRPRDQASAESGNDTGLVDVLATSGIICVYVVGWNE